MPDRRGLPGPLTSPETRTGPSGLAVRSLPPY